MTEQEQHEWASGVHAALFSLAIIAGAVAWHKPLALFLILVAQGLAYIGRFYLMLQWASAANIVAIASVLAAVAAASCLFIGGP